MKSGKKVEIFIIFFIVTVTIFTASSIKNRKHNSQNSLQGSEEFDYDSLTEVSTAQEIKNINELKWETYSSEDFSFEYPSNYYEIQETEVALGTRSVRLARANEMGYEHEIEILRNQEYIQAYKSGGNPVWMDSNPEGVPIVDYKYLQDAEFNGFKAKMTKSVFAQVPFDYRVISMDSGTGGELMYAISSKAVNPLEAYKLAGYEPSAAEMEYYNKTKDFDNYITNRFLNSIKFKVQ